MRVLIESKKVLVIESKGWIVPLVYGLVMLLHALYLWNGPAQAPSEGSNTFILVISGVCYSIGAYLALGPLRDTITVTFHGTKHMVFYERKLPFDKKQLKEFSFNDFTHYEVSEPVDKGFCRLRLKSGKTFHLFKIGKNDEYEVLKHLDGITRKSLEMII